MGDIAVVVWEMTCVVVMVVFIYLGFKGLKKKKGGNSD